MEQQAMEMKNLHSHLYDGINYSTAMEEDPSASMFFPDVLRVIIDSFDLVKDLSSVDFNDDTIDLDMNKDISQDSSSIMTASSRMKQSFSPRSVDSSNSDPDPSNRPIKRMRTYTARKHEIEELLKELPQLESYVEYLKHKAAEANEQTNSTQKKWLVNSCLREKVHQQHYLFARVQSAMSFYTSGQTKMIPFDSYIHLALNSQARMETLQTEKPRILRDSKRYIMERSWHLDLGVPCIDQTNFVTQEGDYCDAKFSVIPLYGITSVKKVFDATLFCIENMAIVLSDATGDLTIRMEDELDEGEIMQHRLLRTVPGDLTVEYNQVTFSHYEESDDEFGDGRGFGLIAFGNVDKDELYPYCPEERLRQDISAVYAIKTYKRKFLNEKKKEEERMEVVVLRACFLKLHHSEMKIESDLLDGTRERLVQFGDTMFNAVKQLLTKQTLSVNM